MAEMLALRVDKWVRVGSGLGLLLLLVAQEKVCPWLFTVPSRPEPEAVTSQPASDESKAAKKRANKRLPHILPDAPAPRWPGAWGQLTFRSTNGDRDGFVNGGRNDQNGDDSPVSVAVGSDPTAWRCFPSYDPASLISLRIFFVPSADPALRTCISHTGPPRV